MKTFGLLMSLWPFLSALWTVIREKAAAALLVVRRLFPVGVGLLFLAGVFHPAFAAPPNVNYQYGNTGAASGIVNAIENFAGLIDDVLGATALLAMLVAALLNHAPSQRSKEMGREIFHAAILGLLIALFAPTLINFITHIQIHSIVP